MSKEKVCRAYWFEPASGVLGYGDGRKPEVGATHKVDCAPVLCNSGLHGSIKALDALQYAASNRLWLVEVGGAVKVGDDKITGKWRKYIAVADIELILREFARGCALDVAHLWDMPDVVREYLETGDESKRAAARAAARAASRAAVRAASRDAAMAASWDASWAAARAAQYAKLEKALERVFGGM